MIYVSMNNDYYVYAHYRNDNNEVFYIGKGRGQRCYDNLRRGDMWNKIVKKAGGFTYKILHDNLTEEESFFIEHKYIVHYGRKKYNEGTLCNLTHGFEGLSGFIHSDETKEIMRQKATGRKISKESGQKIAEANKRRVWNPESIIKGAEKRSGGLNHKAKIVLNTESGIFYETLTEAAKSKNYHIVTLSDNLRGISKENRTPFKYV